MTADPSLLEALTAEAHEAARYPGIIPIGMHRGVRWREFTVARSSDGSVTAFTEVDGACVWATVNS